MAVHHTPSFLHLRGSKLTVGVFMSKKLNSNSLFSYQKNFELKLGIFKTPKGGSFSPFGR